ncbi:hypothetical protein R0J90_24490, partial [Micrococcus sp. SIMBA_144]
ANALFDNLKGNPSFRNFETAATAISNDLGLERGLDFEQINGARKLAENEYTFDRQLGYFSLSRKLQNDEVIAVSYE